MSGGATVRRVLAGQRAKPRSAHLCAPFRVVHPVNTDPKQGPAEVNASHLR